jgi:DNA-binding NtrC family response regulator
MVRILIVDDDRDMQENIAEILGAEGFSVDVANDGEEALELLGENEFDLVLLDLIMPGLGGMDLLPSVKRLNPRAQVIMITAFSTVENAVKAMQRGASDYIAKPFKIDELLVAVKKCLEEARFQSCKAILDMDDTFGSLSHAIRRQILLLLKQTGKARFMEITRKLDIEDHTKMNFHLKVLKDAGLIKQNTHKLYVLTTEGEKVIECLNAVVKGLSG